MWVHREKGPSVCANALTVKIDTVERRLLEAIRGKILSPEPVRYLVATVNRHLEPFRTTEGQARRGLEQELQQVDEELRNVERAILAGVVSETTYRATVAANEGEIVKSLGLTQAFDLGGCGGPQPLAGKQVTRLPLRGDGLSCAVGSRGGRRPNLGGYLTGTRATTEVTAAGER